MHNVKDLITEKYVELISKRNVDKITVKDLVAECGISRQSFYYHFEDLPAVAEWYLSKRFEEVSKKCRDANDFKEALEIFVHHYLNQRDFHQKLFASKYREQYERIASQTIKSYLDALVMQHRYETDLNINELEMIVNFIAYGFLGLVAEAFKRNDVNEKEFVENVYKLLKGPVHSVFKNIPNKN